MAKGKPSALPLEALKDPFRPPRTPRMVRCMHCDQTYMSSLMEYKGGMWNCGTPGCGGAGYHFDIFDADDPFWSDEPSEHGLNEHADHDLRFSPPSIGHDTMFCMTCDEWLEPECSDPACEFCKKRPEKPSMMSEKDRDASKPVEEC